MFILKLQAFSATEISHLTSATPSCDSQEEKRRMKEEIEKRRAEAAEKRQKGDGTEGEAKAAFKCVGSKGPASKVGERLPAVTSKYKKSSCIGFQHLCFFALLDWRESSIFEQVCAEEVT